MHVMYTSQTLSFHSYMNVCDFVDYFKNRNRNEDPWNWSNTPNYFWIKKSRGLSVVVLVLLCSIVHTISTSNHTYCIYLEEKLKRSTVLISLAHQIVNQMCLQSRKQYKIQDRTITATASCKSPHVSSVRSYQWVLNGTKYMQEKDTSCNSRYKSPNLFQQTAVNLMKLSLKPWR